MKYALYWYLMVVQSRITKYIKQKMSITPTKKLLCGKIKNKIDLKMRILKSKNSYTCCKRVFTNT